MLNQVPNADAALVMREFHHRFANTLTIVSAALRCDLASFDDARLRRIIARHERQVLAFAKLFRYLAMGASEEKISSEDYFKPFMEVLASSVLLPLGTRCEVFITDGLLPAKKCEQLALIITELVMNAAKYAFRDRRDGTVRIEICRDGDLWLCSVSDDGGGMARNSKGLGSQIVDALLAILGGEITTYSKKSGTQVLVSFPA